MNNRGKIFTLILVLCLIFGFIFDDKNNKDTIDNRTNAKIGVLQLLSHPALDSIYKGFEDEMKNQGYEIGKNLQLDLQNAQGDQSNLATMSEKLVSEKNDILVAITTPSALSLSNVTKDIPIVMGGVTYPVEAGLIKSEENPGTNITGVSDRTPIDKQLTTIKEILPNMKKLGIIYTSSEDNSMKQAEQAKELAENLGLEVVVKTIANTNDIQQVTEAVASSVDAIYVPIDNTVASAMSTVVKVTDRYKVPVFPSADTMVKDGGVLAIGVDQYNIGVQTARVVIDILNGQDVSTKSIVFANEGIIYLNESKAKELNIIIPEHIKNKSQIIN